MQIQHILFLQWKSFIRHPLFEQTLMFRIMIGCYVFALFASLFVFGMLFVDWVVLLFPEETDILFIFSLTLLPFLLFDLVLKLLFKKHNNLFYSCLLRYPNSKKSIFISTILNEFFNFWNWYLLIFFYFFLVNYIYTDYGLWITTALFIFLWFAQMVISQLVSKIKANLKESSVVYSTSLNLKPTGSISNYLLLSVRMFMRSPLFKRSLFLWALLGGIVLTSERVTSSFVALVLYILILVNYIPMLLTQFLFSAEAAFFDHLMISPNFRQILTAKYILCLFFACVSFCFIVLVHPLRWELWIHFVAIFVYSLGIIVLSFCSILFIDKKMEIFGSYNKLMAYGHSLQSFVISILYLLAMAIVILIYYLFSLNAALSFMLISGVLCVVFHQPWFKYLYRCFQAIKYEKMEIFRIQ